MNSASGGDKTHDGDDGIDGERTIDLNGHTFAGELVDDVEHLLAASIDGGVEPEAHHPDHVRSDRVHYAGLDADACEAILPALAEPEGPRRAIIGKSACR